MTRPLEYAVHQRAFTLIEIMMVVAIMGLAMAVGLPAFTSTMKKEGMRKAVADVEEICAHARESAVLSGQVATVTFHPNDGTIALEGTSRGGGPDQVTSTTLPQGVSIEMLAINLDDYTKSDWAKVFFHPDGTSDEMVLILHSGGEYRKIFTEFSTSLTSVSDVDK